MEQLNAIYEHKHTSPKVYLTMKVFASYIALFLLASWTVSLFAIFGRGWIQFAVSLMWIIGGIGVWKMPETRDTTLKETKWAVLGYLVFLLAYRFVIAKFSQFSPDAVGASLGVNMPVSSASAALGFFQNILMIISVGVPIGYMIWMGQKFKIHHGKLAKDKAFEKYKGLKRSS